MSFTSRNISLKRRLLVVEIGLTPGTATATRERDKSRGSIFDRESAAAGSKSQWDARVEKRSQQAAAAGQLVSGSGEE